jgi:hypothetical protein
MEAQSKGGSSINSDLFFVLFNKDGSFYLEDYIYSSARNRDGVNSMAIYDSTLYLGGFVGDTVIIPGVDTTVTKGQRDAFLAAYHIGARRPNSLAEPAYVKATNGLLAYPNPAKQHLTLLGTPVATEAQLFDLNGRLLRTYSLNMNSFEQQLNLPAVASGTYLLLVTDGEEKQSLKIEVWE